MYLDGVQSPHAKGQFMRVMTLGFSRTLLSTVSSGPGIGISPHAVDQHFNWPVTEAAECH